MLHVYIPGLGAPSGAKSKKKRTTCNMQKREMPTKELQSKVVSQHVHLLGDMHVHVRTLENSMERWSYF